MTIVAEIASRDHEARLMALWGRDYIAEFDACTDWAGEYPQDWNGSEDVTGYNLQRFARMIDRASNPLALLQMQPGSASDLAWALG